MQLIFLVESVKTMLTTCYQRGFQEESSRYQLLLPANKKKTRGTKQKLTTVAVLCLQVPLKHRELSKTGEHRKLLCNGVKEYDSSRPRFSVLWMYGYMYKGWCLTFIVSQCSLVCIFNLFF